MPFSVPRHLRQLIELPSLSNKPVPVIYTSPHEFPARDDAQGHHVGGLIPTATALVVVISLSSKAAQRSKGANAMGNSQRPSDRFAAECRAKLKIAQMIHGKNVTTTTFSNLSKKDAIHQCTVAVKQGLLKEIAKNRWQRTNKSVSLSQQAALSADIKSLEKDGTLGGLDFNSEVERLENETNLNTTPKKKDTPMAYEIDPKTRKVIGSTYSTHNAQKTRRDAILAEARSKRAKLNGDIKNDLGVSTEPDAVAKTSKVDIQEALKPWVGLAGNADLFPFSDGNILKLAGVSMPAPAGRRAEGSVINTPNPVFTGVDVEAHSVATSAVITDELIEDVPHIANSIIESAGDQVQKYIDAQIVDGSEIVSGDPISSHSLVTEVQAAGISGLNLSDFTALCVAHKASRNLVLALSPSIFFGAFNDLLMNAGLQLHRENGELYFNNHRILISDGLADASATASGSCVAVAGNLKQGVVIAERRPLKVRVGKETLPQAVTYLVSGSYGVAVRDPQAISRLSLA